MAAAIDLPSANDCSHKSWSAEQNKLIIYRTHKHTQLWRCGRGCGGVSSRGPLCEPPAWSYISCDGGLWTLAVVSPFSADFMPLLSFTFTQNKQHQGCLLWKPEPRPSLPPGQLKVQTHSRASTFLRTSSFFCVLLRRQTFTSFLLLDDFLLNRAASCYCTL